MIIENRGTFHALCMSLACHAVVIWKKQRQDKRCFKTKALSALFSYIGGQKRRRSRKQRRFTIAWIGKQRQKKQRHKLHKQSQDKTKATLTKQSQGKTKVMTEKQSQGKKPLGKMKASYFKNKAIQTAVGWKQRLLFKNKGNSSGRWIHWPWHAMAPWSFRNTKMHTPSR